MVSHFTTLDWQGIRQVQFPISVFFNAESVGKTQGTVISAVSDSLGIVAIKCNMKKGEK